MTTEEYEEYRLREVNLSDPVDPVRIQGLSDATLEEEFVHSAHCAYEALVCIASHQKDDGSFRLCIEPLEADRISSCYANFHARALALTIEMEYRARDIKSLNQERLAEDV